MVVLEAAKSYNLEAQVDARIYGATFTWKLYRGDVLGLYKVELQLIQISS